MHQRHEVYLGHILLGEIRTEGAHEALVDEVAFVRAESILRGNARNSRTAPLAAKAPKRVYLLTGLARCECGAALSPHPSRQYHYYRCVAVQKRQASASDCRVRQVHAERLEEAVVGVIREAVLKQGMLDDAVTEANRLVKDVVEPGKARLSVLQKQQGTVKAEFRSTVANLASAGLGARDGLAASLLRDLEDRASGLEKAIAEQEALVAGWEAQRVDLDVIRQALSTFENIYEELLPAERQELLGLLVRRVRVTPTEIAVEVYEGGSVVTRVEGLVDPKRRTRRGQVPSAPGTESEASDLGFRARCVLAPHS
jgi:site-specific DNA recombinase